MHIGYCGNVHPGRTINEVKSNLERHALEVKSLARDGEPMDIGLWLSATSSRELEDQARLFEFRDWLAERQLLPFTLNGFPFGDFHQDVVKHDVYLPTWADPDRLDYTLRLAEILNELMPSGTTRTISTLPLGWPGLRYSASRQSNNDDPSFRTACARNLQICAERFADIEQVSGDPMVLCLEPEPGCILDTADDVIAFFNQHLRSGNSLMDDRLHTHIGVCHDVCHSAVMFEEQATAVEAYVRAGIRIGKVQVSSAIEADFEHDECSHQKLMDQLLQFAEPKYLHQTTIRKSDQTEFFEDLSLALDDAGRTPGGLWRIHFHVPIFLESLGHIKTTQGDIQRCLESVISSCDVVPHFEIETYAWNVLPSDWQGKTLATGIARELSWFDELIRGSSAC